MSLSDLLTRGLPKAPANGVTPPAPATYVPNPAMREADTTEVHEFPYQVLPERLRKVVQECREFLSYPQEFTACGIIAATAIALGRTHKLLYMSSWEETPTLYMALVAPPGTAKTHPLLFALAPIIQANKKAIADYNQAQRQLTEAGEVSANIRDKQCLFGDFTIEALLKAATYNRRGVSVYMDELKGFFANFNRYNAGSEQEFWLSNWSNSPYSITRMQRKYFLEWLCINVVGTIQPSMLDEMGKGGRSQNGFTERILFCYPDQVPVIHLPKRNERSDTKAILLRNYTAIIQTLLDRQMAQDGIMDEEDQPHLLTLSPEADDELTDYINSLKERMDKHQNEYLRNVYSKMQTYSIRFCLILNRLRYAAACQDNTDFPPHDNLIVTLQDVRHAATLVEYFLAHAVKAFNALSNSSPLDKLPKDLQNFYHALPIGQELTLKDIESVAEKKGLSRRSMFRLLNEQDSQRRLFQKLRHGVYERLY